MTSGATLALSTKDLRKSYGRQVALAGLTLEVPLGPNLAIAPMRQKRKLRPNNSTSAYCVYR
ncbi:MAG TPA: hypothetical protein VF375_08300 [Candidatus Limnocylindrales bacterium]